MIRYPNGKTFQPKHSVSSQNSQKRAPSYSNRGLTLEDDVAERIKYYLPNQIAVIPPKRTPVQFVHVPYP
ncbi:Holliday junction resolvase RecU, partial [Bacillus spizizenii]|nr:Holliday junction resolvase RecU [Bacillus spizizenii]